MFKFYQEVIEASTDQMFQNCAMGWRQLLHLSSDIAIGLHVERLNAGLYLLFLGGTKGALMIAGNAWALTADFDN